MHVSRFTKRFGLGLLAAVIALSALALPALALDPPGERIYAPMHFAGRNEIKGPFIAQGTFQDRGDATGRADNFQQGGGIVGTARFKGADHTLVVVWRVICRNHPTNPFKRECSGSWRDDDPNYDGSGSFDLELNFVDGSATATLEGTLTKS
jgi:hypothetical protein